MRPRGRERAGTAAKRKSADDFHSAKKFSTTIQYTAYGSIGRRTYITDFGKEIAQIIPVSGLPVKTIWRLVWLKGKRHAPIANAFLQHVKEQKDKIVQEEFGWFDDY